jgi:hypothetical protein
MTYPEFSRLLPDVHFEQRAFSKDVLLLDGSHISAELKKQERAKVKVA